MRRRGFQDLAFPKTSRSLAIAHSRESRARARARFRRVHTDRRALARSRRFPRGAETSSPSVFSRATCRCSPRSRPMSSSSKRGASSQKQPLEWWSIDRSRGGESGDARRDQTPATTTHTRPRRLASTFRSTIASDSFASRKRASASAISSSWILFYDAARASSSPWAAATRGISTPRRRPLIPLSQHTSTST